MITYEELLREGSEKARESSNDDHEHEMEAREFNIEGHRVRGMVCSICGERFFFMKDLLPVEEEIRAREGDTELISVEDALLLLAGTYPEIKIPGKLMAQKEMFLFEKSFAPEYRVNLHPMAFVPYRLGPYSRRVDQAIGNLQLRGLIEIQPLSGGRGKAYLLTEQGKILAEEKKTLVPPEVWEQLRRRRRGWDELGSRGLLKLVYQKFSAYSSQSEIKDEVGGYGN